MAAFPIAKLASLNVKISSPRWVVPVMPEQELECLLNAAIKLTEAGIDSQCEPCQKFYKDELTTSFLKILTDEAVNSWKYNIHYCILISCGKLLHLCALHMKNDNPYLLDLLAIALDPENKFHTHNASRTPELYKNESTSNRVQASPWGELDESQIFACCPPDSRNPKGWLVDLINRFGQKNGFENLLKRFNVGINAMKALPTADDEDLGNLVTSLNLNEDLSKASTSSCIVLNQNKLSLSLIFSLIRPFGQCAEYMSVQTIETYFMPIWDFILNMLQNLSDDELKREIKPDNKNDVVNGIVRSARALIDRVPGKEHLHKSFEMCRLNIILRILQISTFNGKMNALNEINKMLGMVSYYPHRPQTPDEEIGFLTADKMAVSFKIQFIIYSQLGLIEIF